MHKITSFFVVLGMLICPVLQAQVTELPELTPERLKKIKAEADKEAAAYRKSLSKEDHTQDWIDFSTDTFRIARIEAKRMEVDNSTQGMNETVSASTEMYDQLLNKYYNKLLNILKSEDRKVLVSAQRAWILFRDAEKKLIGVTRNEEYSGGGTIQSNIYTGMIYTLVAKRAEAIFDYYNEIIEARTE